MEIIFTKHAEEQKEERKIIREWVEEAIRWPDETRHTNNKYIVVGKCNGGRLKVVYVRERHIKVITCYFVK